MATYQTGIDIKRDQAGNLIIPCLLLDSDGAKVTSGTTTVRLFEIQADGTLHTFDFNDATFKSTACTTPTAAATHRTGDNATYNTGIWTIVLSYAQQADFLEGYHYIVEFANTGASPPAVPRWFQWGGGEGDAASDAELTAAHGAGSWLQTVCQAAGSGLYTIDVTLVDQDDDPAAWQFFQVRDAATETNTAAIGYTDINGAAAINLDAGSYKVRFGGMFGSVAGNVGHYAFSNPYDLTVTASGAEEFECRALSITTGGMTRAEMVGLLEIFVRENFGDSALKVFGLVLMQRLINLGHQEVGQKLRWRRETSTIDMIADTYEYDVALTSRLWERVEYYDDSSDAVRVLEPIAVDRWIEYREKAKSASGCPTYYCREGAVVRLHPTPDDSDDYVTVHGVLDISDLTDDDETPEYPPHLHMHCVSLAISYAYKLMGEHTKALQAEGLVDAQLATETADHFNHRRSDRVRPSKF